MNENYKEQVDNDIECIKSICETDPKQIISINIDEVQRMPSQLKNNKAADAMGLTSEHLKFGGQSLVNFLTDMLNHPIIDTDKEGFGCPERRDRNPYL